MSSKETEAAGDHVYTTSAPKIEHFTLAERAARGKAARAEVPGRVHGEWEPPPHRPDPVDLRDFYVRQLWDGKGSALIDVLERDAYERYARICGWSLAKAHARSGDAVAIASYLGTSDVFEKAMDTFAETYADQNERDYAALEQAVESGRIEAETGP